MGQHTNDFWIEPAPDTSGEQTVIAVLHNNLEKLKKDIKADPEHAVRYVLEVAWRVHKRGCSQCAFRQRHDKKKNV